MRVVLLCALLAAGAALHADEGVDFERQVLPLLEARCFKCHAVEYKGRKRKPKAGLRLDFRDGILRGGDGGPAVVPGQPARSPLYTRAALPDDHDDVMPPDGDVLAPEQLAAIRKWIEAGAPFGAWTGAAPATPRPAPEPAPTRGVGPDPADDRFEVYRGLGEGLAPPPGASMRTAREAGALVEPVYPGSPLLRVEFLANPAKASDKSVEALKGLRNHIAILGLGGAPVTDRSVPAFGRMPRLVRLDLQRTKLTDAGVAALAKQPPPALRRLNLYGTAITDASLDALAGVETLVQLYVWKTKATVAGVGRLRASLPACRVQHVRPLPGAEESGGNERRRRR